MTSPRYPVRTSSQRPAVVQKKASTRKEQIQNCCVKRSPGQPSITQLHLCADKGDIEGISLLLACQAAVDTRNNLGQTPLMLAINRYHQLDMRSIMHTYMQNNNIATICSNLDRYARCINLLILYGASIHLQDRSGESPLSRAISYDNLRIKPANTIHDTQTEHTVSLLKLIPSLKALLAITNAPDSILKLIILYSL